MMLNKNSSSKSPFWKTSLLLPFLLLFIFNFNIKTEAMVIPAQEKQVTSKIEVSAFVTKDSDEETLRSYERIFKKQGVDLKFDDLEFSEGLLTKVTVSFKKESNGTSGNLTLSNAKGIVPLLIYTDGNKVVMNPENAIPKNSEGALIGIGTSPLFIIGGKEYSTSQLFDKYVEIKGEWSVLKPEEAKEQYGSKAKDGAIIISESNIIEDFKAALKDVDLKQMNSKQTFIQVKKNEAPMLLSIKTEINQKTTNSTSSKFELQDVNFYADPESQRNEKTDGPALEENSGSGTIFKVKNIKFEADPEDINAIQRDVVTLSSISFQEEKPLYVVNGEVKGKGFKIQSVQHEKIKSINILKDESAVKKYGENGKHGVIEIILKSKEELANPEKDSGKTRNEKDVKKSVSFTVKDITFDDSKGEGSSTISVSGVSSAMFDSKDALYVINGKEMDKDFDPATIPAENIESMNVIKGQKATEKYGQKAKEGVIEITTKK